MSVRLFTDAVCCLMCGVETVDGLRALREGSLPSGSGRDRLLRTSVLGHFKRQCKSHLNTSSSQMWCDVMVVSLESWSGTSVLCALVHYCLLSVVARRHTHTWRHLTYAKNINPSQRIVLSHLHWPVEWQNILSTFSSCRLHPAVGWQLNKEVHEGKEVLSHEWWVEGLVMRWQMLHSSHTGEVMWPWL